MPLTIYTRGADGVDTHVEHLCHKYQQTCVVLIPPCHPLAKVLSTLSQPQLDAAMTMVTGAAFRLKRHVKSPITLQYAQRHYHVIKDASLVLALGYLIACVSTCWRKQRGRWRWLKCYTNPSVFDVEMEQWY